MACSSHLRMSCTHVGSADRRQPFRSPHSQMVIQHADVVRLGFLMHGMPLEVEFLQIAKRRPVESTLSSISRIAPFRNLADSFLCELSGLIEGESTIAAERHP